MAVVLGVAGWGVRSPVPVCIVMVLDEHTQGKRSGDGVDTRRHWRQVDENGPQGIRGHSRTLARGTGL